MISGLKYTKCWLCCKVTFSRASLGDFINLFCGHIGFCSFSLYVCECVCMCLTHTAIFVCFVVEDITRMFSSCPPVGIEVMWLFLLHILKGLFEIWGNKNPFSLLLFNYRAWDENLLKRKVYVHYYYILHVSLFWGKRKSMRSRL